MIINWHEIQGDNTLKTSILDYVFFGDHYFEPNVIIDSTMKLYHPDRGTTYEFKERGYQQYLKPYKGSETKKRTKSSNPTMNVVRNKSK